MADKRHQKTRRVTIRIEASLLRRLIEEARKQDRSIASFLRVVLRDAVERKTAA